MIGSDVVKGFSIALAALTCAGCGSSDEDRAFTECGALSASFQVTEQLVSGNCAVSSDPFTINVVEKADQTADVDFPDFGARCGGAVNSCNIKGNCAIRAGMPEMITGNINIDLTIQPNGIQGSYGVTLNPGAFPDVPNGCTGRFTVTGTRR